MPDAHANFAYSSVATAPSPATSGVTLVLQSGDGAKFPSAGSFNVTIWPTGVQPSSANAEIARCTRSTDTLTLTRAQEGTSARTVVVGDQVAATVTAKTLTDIEAIDWSLLYNGGSKYRESIPRQLCRDSTVALGVSGVMAFVAVPCVAGDVITNITFRTGGTGATTPTHWWVALYDTSATPALIGQCTDQTTTALAGSTLVTKALSGGSYTVPVTGLYYVGIMFVAATVPNVFGFVSGSGAANLGLIGTQKPVNGTSGSALTTTAPGTIASPASSANIPYVVLS